MADDQIRYDILAQEALRGVMRKVLSEVTKTGLPGAHHFFITFLTGAPGVRISSRLHERYPEQMTIVLQYQYWDLKVTDTGFEVTLSFADIPEKLEIPFSAVRGFYDPSVSFELEFDVATPADAPAPQAVPEAPQDEQAPPSPTHAKSHIGKPQIAKPAKPRIAKAELSTVEEAEGGENRSADVVSLDAFRKK